MTASVYWHDDRVAIRPYQPGDAQPLYAAIQESAAHVSAWLPDYGDLSFEDVADYIAVQPEVWARGKAYNFAIVDHVSGDILGGCGLSQLNTRHRFANLFYWVRSSRTGQGIATRSVRLLARFGFEFLDLRRVEIVVVAGNLASARVAHKAGACREGVLRNRICMRGVSYDALMFSLIPADLEDT